MQEEGASLTVAPTKGLKSTTAAALPRLAGRHDAHQIKLSKTGLKERGLETTQHLTKSTLTHFFFVSCKL